MRTKPIRTCVICGAQYQQNWDRSSPDYWTGKKTCSEDCSLILCSKTQERARVAALEKREQERDTLSGRASVAKGTMSCAKTIWDKPDWYRLEDDGRAWV